MKRLFASILVATACIAACSGSDAADPSSSSGGPIGVDGTSSGGPVGSVTFHRDVEPILQKHCQGCHVKGGIAPFALVTFDDAKSVAASMVQMTHDRLMPPWGAQETADCTPTRKWKDDQRLSTAEIDTIKAWTDGQTPEGRIEDAPPPLGAVSHDLPGTQAELASATGFAMSGTSDKFMCYVLDPKLAAETFVSGMQIVPERPEVVHHVLVFSDPKGEGRAKADANGTYECFGGSGISGATLMTAWAPGAVANQLPEGVGMPLEAGSLIVMQVHYHAAPGLSAPPDRTKLQLRYYDGKPTLNAYTQLLGNFRQAIPGLGGLMAGPNDSGKVEFHIPPNVKDHTETMKVALLAQVKGKPVSGFKLLSTAGHMHYVGVGEQITVARKAATATQPANECLLSIPHWDFDWQRGYAYDAPIDQLPAFSPGDEISIKCTYDNTMANPKMGRALHEAGLSAPQDVTLGESTLDEMCLGAFVFVYPP